MSTPESSHLTQPSSADKGDPSPRPASRPRPLLGLLFLLLLTWYLLTAKGLSDLIDAEAIYLITEAMVERGWVDLPAEGGLSPHIHGDGHTFEGPDGRLYSQYWPGYALFQVPWYLLGKGAGAVAAAIHPQGAAFGELLPRVFINLALCVAAAAAATLLAAAALLLHGDRRWAIGAALLLALGTVAWPYAKIGFYEPFLGLCLLLTLYCLARYAYRSPRLGWLLLAGLAWGCAVITKPTAALSLPAFLIYYLWQRRRSSDLVGFRAAWWREWGAAALGLVPWIAVALWYNWARSGDPFDPGYASWNWELTFTPGKFFSLLGAYLVGPGRSFLFFSPAVIIALAGLPRAWRGRPAETLAIALIFLSYWIFHSARVATDPWAWGARYLVPTVAVVMLLAPWGLEALAATRRRRVLLVALVVLAVLVQVLAVVVPYGAWLHVVQSAEGSTGPVIWSPQWWPLAGQISTLSQVQTAPLELPGAGPLPEDFKHSLRHSLDFWWFYAWRLGVPAPLVALPALLLLALSVGLALRLARAARQ